MNESLLLQGERENGLKKFVKLTTTMADFQPMQPPHQNGTGT